jgi:hypothetical protein
MTQAAEPEPHTLKPGDRVWWCEYGNGVVLSASEFWLCVLWEKAGRLDHLPLFARWLTRS